MNSTKKVMICMLVFVCLCLLSAPDLLSINDRRPPSGSLSMLLLEPEEQRCIDSDNDSYFAQEDCGTSIDCDDTDPDVNPGAGERCDDKDNDCDLQIDEEDAIGCTRYYLDSDRDSYGKSA